MKIDKNLLSRVCQNDLFSSVDPQELLPFVKDAEIYIEFYKGNDVVYSSEKYVSAIGFILKGEAKVYKKGSDLVVGRLFENDVYGFQSLFLSGEYFTNEIIASTDMAVLYISKKAVSYLLCEKNSFSLDYIRFLSKKIHFLNRRIVNFTGKSAESRLAEFLLEAFGDYKTYILDLSLSQLAVMLDISRASLYRSFDKLVAADCIERKGKVIRLKNKDALASFI